MSRDDIHGRRAVQLLELEYMTERCRDRADERRLAELREAIELAKGWKRP